MHFCQSQVIASYGAQLLDWLQNYTFVEEQKFADPSHAARTRGMTPACLMRGQENLRTHKSGDPRVFNNIVGGGTLGVQLESPAVLPRMPHAMPTNFGHPSGG